MNGDLIVHQKTMLTMVDKLPPKIHFIGDLHFNRGNENGNEDVWDSRKQQFLKLVNDTVGGNDILCLLGDFYDDFKLTLAFIQELESLKIKGFCVLGNHDYWHDGRYSYIQLLDIFEKATRKNKYFRLLMTGRKYYVGDLCVIGDTGWSSFRRSTKSGGVGRRVSFKKLPNIPEFQMVRDFSYKQVLSMHTSWVAFANSVYIEERQVLTLTHFPMIDFTESASDCWWSSKTELNNTEGWCLFGHTHGVRQKYYNHVSHQRGYKDTPDTSLGSLTPMRIPVNSSTRPTVSNMLLSKTFDATLANNMDSELAKSYIKSVRKRGYKRCAANLKTMSELIESPDEYLDTVEDNLLGYIENDYSGYIYECNTRFRSLFPKDTDYRMMFGGLRMGFDELSREDKRYVRSLSRDDLESLMRTPERRSSEIQNIGAAIDIIRQNDLSDIRLFMTAVVVTGYAYNGMIYALKDMRPVDDYDVVRLATMYYSIRKNGLTTSKVNVIRKSDRKDDFVMFKDVPIYLPVINGKYRVSKAEIANFIEGVPLLNEPLNQGLLQE